MTAVPPDPLRRTFGAGPWRATGYLLAYVFVGTALFGVALAAVVVTVVAGVTWLGLPLLIATAAVIRACAEIERHRNGLVGPAVRGRYVTTEDLGILAQVQARWTDPATYRDCLYLILLYPVLMGLGLAAAVLWLADVALVLLPLWFWAVPNGDLGDNGVIFGYVSGHDVHGYRVRDLPSALLAAAAFLILSPLFAKLVIAAAKTHRTVAGRLLGPTVDPLAEARRIVSEPGPLAAHR